MAQQEPQQTPRMLLLLLCCQMIFLGALYLKMNAIHGSLVALHQSATGGSGQIEAIVPEVTSGNGPSLGNPAASVEIVAFSDFGCSACRKAQPVLAEMLEKHGGTTRLAYRHFPLRPEGAHLESAIAAQCAHEQGEFWPMYDLLFDQEKSLERATIETLAKRLAVDQEAFLTCLDAEESRSKVEEDRAAGTRWGVTGTPTLFINGRRISGVPNVEVLQTLVQQIRQQDAIPPLDGDSAAG